MLFLISLQQHYNILMHSTSTREHRHGSFQPPAFLSTPSQNKKLLNLLFYSHSCTVMPLTKPIILFNVILTLCRGQPSHLAPGRSGKGLFRGDTCFCSFFPPPSAIMFSEDRSQMMPSFWNLGRKLEKSQKEGKTRERKSRWGTEETEEVLQI